MWFLVNYFYKCLRNCLQKFNSLLTVVSCNGNDQLLGVPALGTGTGIDSAGLRGGKGGSCPGWQFFSGKNEHIKIF